MKIIPDQGTGIRYFCKPNQTDPAKIWREYRFFNNRTAKSAPGLFFLLAQAAFLPDFFNVRPNVRRSICCSFGVFLPNLPAGLCGCHLQGCYGYANGL
jgi:hypothetical protein